MPEAAKHYELPWKLDEFQRDGETWGYIVSRHDTIVCEIAGILDSCGNRENAEFIVKAVNAFEAQERLIETLTKALEPLIHYEAWMDDYPDETVSSTYRRHTYGDLRRARTALSQAKRIEQP